MDITLTTDQIRKVAAEPRTVIHVPRSGTAEVVHIGRYTDGTYEERGRFIGRYPGAWIDHTTCHAALAEFDDDADVARKYLADEARAHFDGLDVDG